MKCVVRRIPPGRYCVQEGNWRGRQCSFHPSGTAVIGWEGVTAVRRAMAVVDSARLSLAPTIRPPAAAGSRSFSRPSFTTVRPRGRSRACIRRDPGPSSPASSRAITRTSLQERRWLHTRRPLDPTFRRFKQGRRGASAWVPAIREHQVMRPRRPHRH